MENIVYIELTIIREDTTKAKMLFPIDKIGIKEEVSSTFGEHSIIFFDTRAFRVEESYKTIKSFIPIVISSL